MSQININTRCEELRVLFVYLMMDHHYFVMYDYINFTRPHPLPSMGVEVKLFLRGRGLQLGMSMGFWALKSQLHCQIWSEQWKEGIRKMKHI